MQQRLKQMELSLLRSILWNQFGAAVDMLTNCIHTVPDDYFDTHKRAYYIAYHSVIFLDYYSSFPPSGFSPRLSFTQQATDLRPPESIDDLIPDKLYSKAELLNYINEIRSKCRILISTISEERLQTRFTEGSESGDMDCPFLEIFLYNMRHTAHHVGQLSLLIRQDLNQHVEWSFREGDGI